MSTTNALIGNYRRQDCAFVRGQNARLYDDRDREYIDLHSGIAVVNVGHANPRVTARLQQQAERLLHVSNFFRIPAQEQLALRLQELSGARMQSFFCNSGAEANEAAVKLARLHSYNRYGADRYTIITLERSFHGRTMAGISATGQDKVKMGFNPLLNGFVHVAADDLDAVRRCTPGAAAVLIELVQGEGGVHPLDRTYVRELRELCREQDLLFMIDEVQTGMGRTGTMFAYEQYDIEPDVVTLAKGLGNGAPIGAMLAVPAVAASLAPGTHGSTFGGNPLCAEAALGVLDSLESDRVLENVRERASQIATRAGAWRERGLIRAERGLGLLRALELPRDMPDLVSQGLQRGLVLNQTSPGVLRIMPPLSIEADLLDQALDRLQILLEENL